MASGVSLSVVSDPSEPGAAEIIVPVELSGHRYSFLLDTGAAGSRIVADNFTRSLGRAAANLQNGEGALGRAVSTSRVVVPDLTIGNITVFELAIDLAVESAPGPPCILGLDVLRGHRLDFRFMIGELTLDGYGPIDRNRRLLTSSTGHPHGDVEWDGASARAVWDSGAGVTVVDRDFVLAHPDLFVENGRSVGTDAHGNEQETPMVMMSRCRIGGRPFAPTVAAVADIAGIQSPENPSFELIVGYPLIAQADWSVDLHSSRWGFL